MTLYAKCKFSILVLCINTVLFGCAATNTKPYDYTAFHNSHPRSILILPPLNSSVDVNAATSVFSHATWPLVVSGYYVFPIGLVDQIFRENGLITANDIHTAAPAKLRDIFGADAALYMNIKEYGTIYVVINSVTVVTVEAKLVDLKTGIVIWNGDASASSDAGGDAGGEIGDMLLNALVNQIVANIAEKDHEVARIATNDLLTAGRPDGILYGPYYKEPSSPQPSVAGMMGMFPFLVPTLVRGNDKR